MSQDVALGTEVVFARLLTATDWDEIATTLSAALATPQREVDRKGWGCREHLDLLIKKYTV